MDLRTRLDVVHSGVSDTNYSVEAHNFTRDPFSITLDVGEFIYVGFNKPFNALYAAITTANTIGADLTVQFNTTSGWVDLDVSDDTKAFTRSGFITWNREDMFENAVIGQEGWEATTVNGKEQFWVRIITDTTLDATTFQALNLVFADDNDVQAEEPSLVDDCFYPTGQTSHILRHLSAKNNIMMKLKNLGYVKYSTDTGEQNLNEWDILDIYEMKQAALHYAISQIYFNLADDPEDQYWAKYREYDKKFEESFAIGRLRIDENNNGQVDSSEKKRIQSLRWVR